MTPPSNAQKLPHAVRHLARRLRSAPNTVDGASTRRRLVLVAVSSAEAEEFLKAAWIPLGWESTVTGPDPKLAGGKGAWDEIVVLADSVASLRRSCPWLGRVGKAQRFQVAVLATDRADLLNVPSAHRVERRHVGPDGVVISVETTDPMSARDLVRRVLGSQRANGRSAPSAGLRVGLTSVDVLDWAAGDSAVSLVGPKTQLVTPVEHEHFDFLVGPPVASSSGETRIPRLEFPASLALPPVDTAVVSPIGYTRDTTADLGRVDLDPERIWLLGPDGRAIGAGYKRVGLTENHIAALRGLAGVIFASAAGVSTLAAGRVLTQIACAGVPVRPLDLPVSLRDVLGDDLAARFTVDWNPADPYERETWSVRTRRIALEFYGPERYWARIGARHARPCAPPPAVSVLLSTRRPNYVSFALAQIERQDWPHIETILVLHGIPADHPSVREAVRGFSRPLEVVEVDNQVVFGQALNLGTERCSGRLVTKMDDDDWYGPHHITDLVQARAYSGATMVGIAGYHVYLHRSGVTIRRSSRATESWADWLAGPTMLLATEDLRVLGGWRPVPGSVDFHLLASVRNAGGSLYGMHDLGFLYYRGGQRHTWAAHDEDAAWLDRATRRWPGFRPPPEVDPLPHPAAAGTGSSRM